MSLNKKAQEETADSQIVRTLALVHAIANAKRGVSLKQLADRRGWNLRALYRDIEALKRAKFPIEHVHGKYSMPIDWLPPSMVGVARDELLALFVARHASPGLQGTPFARSLDRLWAKLATKDGQVALVPASQSAMGFRAGAIDYGAHEGTIRLLLDGIAKRRALRIEYRKTSGETSVRTIEPGHVRWDGGLEAMYVLSWCCERKAVRIFAVQRITAIEMLDEVFVSRAATSLQALDKSFRVWHRDHASLVVLRFSQPVAGEIRERTWHKSQQLKELKNGSLELRLLVSAPEELQRWLVGYGIDVEVVEPLSLAQSVRQVHVAAIGIERMATLPSRAKKPRAQQRTKIE